MALKVNVEKRKEDIYVVKANGHIDTDTYLQFEEKIKPLLNASTKALILDMTDVSYISSAGLTVIFNAKKVIEENKGNFIVTNLQPQIKKVFDIVRALPKESVFVSMEEVDSYLDNIQQSEIEKIENPPEA